jgi:hypothetical protein
MKRLLAVLLLLMCTVSGASASGTWLMFDEDHVPEEQGFRVQEKR